MEPRKEQQPSNKRDRAILITTLNESLAAIKRGEMPGDHRADILNRRRELTADQSAAKRRSRTQYVGR